MQVGLTFHPFHHLVSLRFDIFLTIVTDFLTFLIVHDSTSHLCYSPGLLWPLHRRSYCSFNQAASPIRCLAQSWWLREQLQIGTSQVYYLTLHLLEDCYCPASFFAICSSGLNCFSFGTWYSTWSFQLVYWECDCLYFYWMHFHLTPPHLLVLHLQPCFRLGHCHLF